MCALAQSGVFAFSKHQLIDKVDTSDSQTMEKDGTLAASHGTRAGEKGKAVRTFKIPRDLVMGSEERQGAKRGKEVRTTGIRTTVL